jgi:iron complex transport system substrate-binding protein
VPAPPARVVAGTDGAELAALVALGITPVGFGQRNDPLRPWLRGEVDGVDTYDLAGGETNFEQLAAWQPDLLLVQRGFAEADTYPRFSAVAPTVVTSFIDWRTSLRQTADAVARTDDGEALIATTEEQVAAAAGRLQPYAGLRVGFISVFSGGLVYVMNDQSPVGKLLDELGLQPLPAAVAAGAAVDELPLEQLGSLDVDALFVQRFEPDLSPYEELAAGDLFQRLPAARAGKVVVLEEDESHASYFDAVLTVPLNLAMLERRLGEVA